MKIDTIRAFEKELLRIGRQLRTLGEAFSRVGNNGTASELQKVSNDLLEWAGHLKLERRNKESPNAS